MENQNQNQNQKIRYNSKRVCSYCIKGLFEENEFGLCMCYCHKHIRNMLYSDCKCHKEEKFKIVKNMISEQKRKMKKGIYVIFDSDLGELYHKFK